MKPLLVLLFSTVFAYAYAGEIPKKHKRERTPPQWDTLFHKNELSLDGSLPLGFMLNGHIGEGSVALTYLRALTKSNFLRVGIRHRFQEYHESSNNYSSYLYPYQGGTAVINGTVFTQTDKSYRLNAPDLRFGYEHRFGKRRIKAILGIDLSLGVEFENLTYTNTNFQPIQTVDSSGHSVLYITQLPMTEADSYGSEQINLKIGACPFVGMFVHLSKRFSLRACVMYDFYWAHKVAFTTYGPTPGPAGDSFKTGTWAIIGDLAFTVHF